MKKNKLKNILNEEIIINTYLRKLNFNKKTTFDFQNDAAIIKIPKRNDIVVSQDTLVENTHFNSSDSAKSIAIKSIMVNLSDLTSMGAIPYAYTMSLTLNSSINKKWMKEFSESLFKQQKKYNFYLMGGDIVKGNKVSITITIFGLINQGKYITREGAEIYDDIWITGNIGDSYIGYKILKKKLFIKKNKNINFFLNAYFFPNPPIIISSKLNKYMSSAIDISDGLYRDLERISVDFSKGARIFKDSIPISKNAKKLLYNKQVSMGEILSGGDDYQLIFTSNPKNREKIIKLSRFHKITRVGIINKTKKICIDGYNLKNIKKGYIHQI